jgi:hypothetical protein
MRTPEGEGMNRDKIWDERNPAWAGGRWSGYEQIHQKAQQTAEKYDRNILADDPRTTQFSRRAVPHEHCILGEPCRTVQWTLVWFVRPGHRLRMAAPEGPRERKTA